MNQDISIADFQVDKEKTLAQFASREYQHHHLEYEKEFAFYNAVRDGNVKEVKALMVPLKSELLGRLSHDNLRNLKYHLIITIAIITRFSIEGGMLPENAYTLSDVYIQKLDICRRESDITKLHETVILDFTRKVRDIKKQQILSKPVVQVMDYVYEHLQEKLRLDDIAEAVRLNKTYLCVLFKKETGITLGDYIMERKIETAKNMLAYSNYSSVEISDYLSFSSHSHFISAFQKKTGTTPKQYRNTHYRNYLRD